ncbi:MAG: C40 family peptidase [Myxococcales bacterium]|nr:C40 family peptidase [Myxococcales bacterium]USN51356.1 MAG: C40 family peptidase [Myxococcales bacterium]
MKNVEIIYCFICLISSFSLLAGKEKKIVNKGVACCYLGPINGNNYPHYKQSALKKIPSPGFLDRDFCLCEEYLFNESVCYEPSLKSKNWGFCSQKIKGEYSFGGLMEQSSLSEHLDSAFTHIVIDPVLKVDLSEQKDMQLSMGTHVKILGELGEKYFVQIHGDNGNWVSKESLSKIDELKNMDEVRLRAQIVAQARKLIGQPYKWGGRCAFEGHGYDCAGLVKTAYMSCAKELARPVGYQRQMSTKISFDDLLPGDVLFSVNKHEKAVHVAMWTGENTVIEASPISMDVREVSLEEAFACDREIIRKGRVFYSDKTGDYSVSCAKFF